MSPRPQLDLWLLEIEGKWEEDGSLKYPEPHFGGLRLRIYRCTYNCGLGFRVTYILLSNCSLNPTVSRVSVAMGFILGIYTWGITTLTK